jgi:hypothetical protein
MKWCVQARFVQDVQDALVYGLPPVVTDEYVVLEPLRPREWTAVYLKAGQYLQVQKP